MLNLMKNGRKRLMISTVLVFSFYFTSCQNLPPKPQIDLGLINYPAQTCDFSSTESLQSLEDLEYSKILLLKAQALRNYSKNLRDCDKYIVMSPEDWEKLSTYTKKLRAYAEEKCHQ